MRVNERIRVPRIRVIDPEGKQLGILETRDALRMAQEEAVRVIGQGVEGNLLDGLQKLLLVAGTSP